MSRMSLFDPLDDSTGEKLESVSALTARIKSTLEQEFDEVAIRAEVSNVARPRSGHVYLSLKDDVAQVRAVIWKGEAQRLVFDLSDGLAVRVWGRISVYAPRGEYQVTIRKIEPEGIGALELAFRQ
ncbi:exodeoxyribonuclease VII large subunit, partial [Singulisphaera rosea]